MFPICMQYWLFIINLTKISCIILILPKFRYHFNYLYINCYDEIANLSCNKPEPYYNIQDDSHKTCQVDYIIN